LHGIVERSEIKGGFEQRKGKTLPFIEPPNLGVNRAAQGRGLPPLGRVYRCEKYSIIPAIKRAHEVEKKDSRLFAACKTAARVKFKTRRCGRDSLRCGEEQRKKGKGTSLLFVPGPRKEELEEWVPGGSLRLNSQKKKKR